MPRTEFQLTGKWKRLELLLDKERFATALEANVKRATQANAMVTAREVRQRISGRRYKANAALTILIKRSSLPLVDDSDLFNSVTHQMIDSKTAFVGALRSARVGDISAADIASILHEGVSIPVTQAMRGLFYALAAVGAGKMKAEELTGRAAELAQRLGSRIRDVKPLRASTTAIVIPPRPFLREVFEDPMLVKRLRANWEQAVDGAVRSISPAAG